MTPHTRRRLLGVVLTLLGVVTTLVGGINQLETRWVVDPLRYREVRYLEGYRSGDTIHLVADDGRIYRVPESLWPDGADGRALAAVLERDTVAAARVRGGRNPWWFGYPTVEQLDTPSLTLDGPPRGRLRAALPLLLGPFVAAGGVWLVRRPVRR